MNLFSIAFKSIRQRLLASSLTSLSVALAIMLMVLVLVIFGIVEQNFQGTIPPYDLIAGPKGSSLQLVLATVYRIGEPEAYLPWQYYLDLTKDRRVKDAVPITMGDLTKKGGFKIVGTTSRYFELGYADGKPFKVEHDSKRFGTPFDAIIGADVARTNNWWLGSQFQLVHSGAEHAHEEKFTVVAVLKRTGTANDKTVFINIDGFFAIGGHDKEMQEAIDQYQEFYGQGALAPEEIQKLLAEEQKELAAESGDGGHHHHHHATPDIKKNVSAVFIKIRVRKNPLDVTRDVISMEGESKRGYRAQFVNPVKPINLLMSSFVGNVQTVLFAMTCLIIAVSGVGIFVSIYNSMADRKKEIAIMRALGARRSTVFSIILLESILLCVGGGILGLVLGHGAIYVSAGAIERAAGILVDPLAFEPLELVLFPVLITLAALIGFIPGMTAYRTDVAKSLAS